MATGKPFPKVTDVQRKAATDALKRDGLAFLRDIGLAGAKAAGNHLQQHPESAITQVAIENRHAISMIVGGVAAYVKGGVVPPKPEEASGQPSASSSASSPGAPKPPVVVDAEIIDD